MEQTHAAGGAKGTTGREQEQRAGWKDDRSFILDLGCFTSAIKDAGAGHKPCKIRLSSRFTVTGFHEGDGKARASASGEARGWSSRSYVEVNRKFLLSLEPAVLGTVLGIDSQGLAVPARIFGADKEEIYQHVDSRTECRVWHGGFLLSSMKPPELVEYIVKRQQELFLDCRGRGVSTRDAFCLMREHKHKVTYNWAEVKLESIKVNLRNKRGGGSEPFRSVLISYIEAALPALSKFQLMGEENGPDASGGVGAVGVEEACQEHTDGGGDGSQPQKGNEREREREREREEEEEDVQARGKEGQKKNGKRGERQKENAKRGERPKENGKRGDREPRRLRRRNDNTPNYHESESDDETVSEEDHEEPPDAEPQTPSPRGCKRRIGSVRDLEEDVFEEEEEEGDAVLLAPRRSRKRRTERFKNSKTRINFDNRNDGHRGSAAHGQDAGRRVAGVAAQAPMGPEDAQLERQGCGGPLCKLKSVDDLMWCLLERGLQNFLRWVQQKRSQANNRCHG